MHFLTILAAGSFWQTFHFGAFADSAILDTNQQALLYGFTGTRWVLCYRLSKHGANAWQWRILCGNRGPSVTIMRSTYNNRIFGAFSEQFWNHRWGGYFYQGQGCTTSSFLWRFD